MQPVGLYYSDGTVKLFDDIQSPRETITPAPLSFQIWGPLDEDGEQRFSKGIQVVKDLDIGRNQVIYTDRIFTLKALPDLLRNAWRVVLPNDLKLSPSNPMIMIKTMLQGCLYVAVDEYLSIEKLERLEPTDYEIYVRADRTLIYNLYRVPLHKGESIQFPPIADINANMHLFFFVEERTYG